MSFGRGVVAGEAKVLELVAKGYGYEEIRDILKNER
jgi:hypothetical protein